MVDTGKDAADLGHLETTVEQAFDHGRGVIAVMDQSGGVFQILQLAGQVKWVAGLVAQQIRG